MPRVAATIIGPSLRAAEAWPVRRAPVAVPEAVAFDRSRLRDYDWVVVDGHFTDAPVFLLDNQQLETPRAYAGVVLLAALAVGLFVLTAVAERFAVPWNRKGARTA